MPESIIVAEVKTFKDLRRQGEELILFYLEGRKINSMVVNDTLNVASKVYGSYYIYDDAYLAFSRDKELKGRVAFARVEVHGGKREYKVLIENLDVLDIITAEAEVGIMKRIYFERRVAETLGLEDGQSIKLLPSPIWKKS